MKLAAFAFAISTAIFLQTNPVFADTTPDDILLSRLSATKDEDQRADLITRLETRTSDPVRIALEQIASDEAEPASVRMSAICALGGSATSQTVPLLIDITTRDIEDRHGFWACAIPHLGNLSDRRAVPLLHQIANLNEDHLAGMDHMAISALANMAGPKDVDFLQAKAFIFPVRTDVMVALARVGAISSAPTLIFGLQDGEEPEVIEAATAGLAKIGAPALPFLRVALENNPDTVMTDRLSALISVIEP